MAAASCVIGVTILKSRNVRFEYRKNSFRRKPNFIIDSFVSHDLFGNICNDDTCCILCNGFRYIFLIFLDIKYFRLKLGAIPWMLSTEMFFQSERAYASTIAIIVNWLSAFCIIMTFIPLFVSENFN